MKVIDFTVCEDIRREIGEKHTLVGVLPFDTNITVTSPNGEQIKPPIPLKFSFFIRTSFLENIERPTRFKLVNMLNGKENGFTDGKLDIPAGIKYLNMALSLNLRIPENGDLTFIVQFLENDKIIYEYKPEYNIKIII